MFAKIINPNYIKMDSILKEYIQCDTTCESIKTDLIKSIINKDNVKPGDEFELIDIMYNEFDPNLKSYIAIKNETGTFLVREDNLEFIEEIDDILEELSIKRIIKNGDKTILIDNDNNKYITTRQEEDEDDPEKAIMILLLKYAGYNIKDVYKIIDLIK